VSTIRIGVIGCGGISGHHLKTLQCESLKNADVRVTAFCDVNRDSALARRKEFGAGAELATTDYHELLDSGEVDAVLISTPHPFHPEAGIAAFERGIHVLLEKPVAITAADARHINEAHRRSKSVYTVHFQNRHMPMYRWVKRQIDAGLLGPLHKASILWNSAYRPQSYYDSGTWRGTWLNEGGGVMMNQCPHDLDIFCWWLGLPASVDARIWLGRCHEIEVEDEILALLKFDGGGIAVINSTTCDFPGSARWDIVGDDGSIIVDGANVKALRNETSLSSYTKNNKDIWAPPKTKPVEADFAGDKGPVATESVWLNFLAAIRGTEPLFMDGEEGAMSVELANAIIASGFLGRPVDLPVDEGLYDHVLAELRAGKSGAALSPQKRKKKAEDRRP
jgi:predicted dehydrogenase